MSKSILLFIIPNQKMAVKYFNFFFFSSSIKNEKQIVGHLDEKKFMAKLKTLEGRLNDIMNKSKLEEIVGDSVATEDPNAKRTVVNQISDIVFALLDV